MNPSDIKWVSTEQAWLQIRRVWSFLHFSSKYSILGQKYLAIWKNFSICDKLFSVESAQLEEKPPYAFIDHENHVDKFWDVCWSEITFLEKQFWTNSRMSNIAVYQYQL